jgi:hypothetical protein
MDHSASPALKKASPMQYERKGKGTNQMAQDSHAFLLRCWKEPDGNGEPAWRFSLVYINEKGEKKGFTSLEAVISYLHKTLVTFECKNSIRKHP